MLGKLLEGRRGMLVGAVKGTEWGDFLDYVTPSFFEVVGFRDLLSQGRELGSNLTDSRGFEALRKRQTEVLASRGIEIEIAPSHAAGDDTATADDRAFGQRVLEVYFGQLYVEEATILDLRAGRWSWPDPADTPRWQPRPLWIRWEPDFLAAVRDLYTGFYRDDDAVFDRGIEALRLGPAVDALRAHFGEGDQRAVTFETKVFHSSFHDVFVRCRDEGVALHRNFLALGLYLACLYDALEGRGALDVRDAFERAVG